MSNGQFPWTVHFVIGCATESSFHRSKRTLFSLTHVHFINIFITYVCVFLILKYS